MEDVIEATHDFFQNNRIHNVVNCTMVTLIPKSPTTKTMKEITPIIYCTTVYKIISKILITKLSNVITTLVDDSESTFVPGKAIHDNNIITHELLRDYNRKHISPRRAIQMDLQIAYDIVKLMALENIMKEMNFLGKYIKRIMICINIVSYKYAINRYNTKTLKAKRGLKQGDSVPPFLFMLIMEYLHRVMKKLHRNHNFNYHPKCDKLKITNICFVDDLIMFTK